MRNSHNERESKLKWFHILPTLTLPTSVENIYGVSIKNRSSIESEKPEDRAQLERLFSLFQDPAGKNLQHGLYFIDCPGWKARDIWELLRFAVFLPSDNDEGFMNFDAIYRKLTDWYAFVTTEERLTRSDGMVEVHLNGLDIWLPYADTPFFTHIQSLHTSTARHTVPVEGIALSRRIGFLLTTSQSTDAETRRLATRLTRAIRWYNSSYYGDSWTQERAVLDMAIAFEALFQTPKENIAQYLETALAVIFPDNEFIPKWLKQFYTARSTVAHGSSIDPDNLRFRPDRSEHLSLIHWARRIFRSCVEATIAQWEASRNSGLLKAMTPNRLRLNRLNGKLQTTTIGDLTQSILEDIKADIEGLHSNWFDVPADSSMEQTVSIGEFLAKAFIRNSVYSDPEIEDSLNRLLNLPKDWYKQEDYRNEALELYDSIISKFGDEASLLSPATRSEFDTITDQILYQWAKFAYLHIYSLGW